MIRINTLRIVFFASALVCPRLASADTLTVYSIPSPHGQFWGSPRALIAGAVVNNLTLERKKHILGHTVVEYRTDDGKRQLLGVSNREGVPENRAVMTEGYGFGALLESWEGKLQSEKALAAEIDQRLASGKISFMAFDLNQATSDRVASYLAAYKRLGLDQVFGGVNNRPRHCQGGGCSAFGVGFLEAAGLLRGNYLGRWSKRLRVPKALIGGPVTGQSVGVGRIITSRAAGRWARADEPHILVEAISPDLMVGWVRDTWATLQGKPGTTSQILAGRLTARLRGRARGIEIDATAITPPSGPLFDGQPNPLVTNPVVYQPGTFQPSRNANKANNKSTRAWRPSAGRTFRNLVIANHFRPEKAASVGIEIELKNLAPERVTEVLLQTLGGTRGSTIRDHGETVTFIEGTRIGTVRVETEGIEGTLNRYLEARPTSVLGSRVARSLVRQVNRVIGSVEVVTEPLDFAKVRVLLKAVDELGLVGGRGSNDLSGFVSTQINVGLDATDGPLLKRLAANYYGNRKLIREDIQPALIRRLFSLKTIKPELLAKLKDRRWLPSTSELFDWYRRFSPEKLSPINLFNALLMTPRNLAQHRATSAMVKPRKPRSAAEFREPDTVLSDQHHPSLGSRHLLREVAFAVAMVEASKKGLAIDAASEKALWQRGRAERRARRLTATPAALPSHRLAPPNHR